MSSKLPDKCRKSFLQNFRRQFKILKAQPHRLIWWTRSFLLLTPFTSDLLCVKFYGEGGRLNHFKYFRTRRAMLMNFWIFNTPRFQIFISGCKAFSLFQQIFVFEKVIRKTGLYSKLKSLHHPQPPRHPFCLFWSN